MNTNQNLSSASVASDSPNQSNETRERFAVIRKTTHGHRSRTKDVALGVRSYGWHQTDGHSCASLTLSGPLGESFTVDFDIATFDAIGKIVNGHRATSD